MNLLIAAASASSSSSFGDTSNSVPYCRDDDGDDDDAATRQIITITYMSDGKHDHKCCVIYKWACVGGGAWGAVRSEVEDS